MTEIVIRHELFTGARADSPTNQRHSTLPSVKRTFDIMCSLCSMIVFSPLILVLSIIIKLSEGGQILFRQERIGLDGKPFMLYKFRSMNRDSESDGVPRLCKDEDERLTGIGRFMRNHHLDELPQLWNVLRGDMSFVGYRPERQYFIDKITQVDPRYVFLYHMRPGLFSKATLYNGYTDTMEKMICRLNMDLEYYNNHSLWIDIKIIAATAWSILSGRKF